MKQTIYFSLIIILIISASAFSQTGGPPMITDDPGTPGSNNWEINLSVNSEVTHITELEAPLLDINYGYKNHTQFKIEVPLLFTETENKNFTSKFGNPIVGIKFRFIDEENRWIDASVYPQVLISFSGDKNQYKLPLQLEKKIGNFIIGQEAGVLLSFGYTNFLEGTVIGFKCSDNIETMAEWYLEKDVKRSKSIRGFLNFGIRYKTSNKLSILVSVGKQLETPGYEQAQHFFSYTGIQFRL